MSNPKITIYSQILLYYNRANANKNEHFVNVGELSKDANEQSVGMSTSGTSVDGQTDLWTFPFSAYPLDLPVDESTSWQPDRYHYGYDDSDDEDEWDTGE